MIEISEEQALERMTNYPDELTLLFFVSPFCYTCRVEERKLEVLEKMIAPMKIIKINGMVSPNLIEKFKITKVPSLLLVKDNELKSSIYTFYSIPEIFEKINRLQSD
ncbi:thioredoxin family protein [Bacillaceae bacterium S4-13-56]